MNNETTKRAGGEKRGNKYDRDRRGCAMHGHWADENGHVYCAYCGDVRLWFVSGSAIAVWQDRMTAYTGESHVGMAPAEVFQQDRIDPTGGYTMGNLAPACRKCNAELSNTPAADRADAEALFAFAATYRRGSVACTHGGHRRPGK